MKARRTWWGLAAAAAVAAAACSEGTAPQLSNPQQLNSDIQTVAAVFEAPVFQSFGAVGTAPGSPAAAPTVPGAALFRATIPAAPPGPGQAYAATPQRLQALRAAAAGMSPTNTAGVIPSQYLGKTYVWDVTTHAYVVGPDAGPSNGVRIILYQVDANGNVIEPTVAVGFVDLLDLSDANTNKLQVIVKSGTPASPGTTYADYTVSATVTKNGAGVVSEFTATASGFVSDGTRRLDFTAQFHATNLDTDNPDAQIDVTWALNTPPVSVGLHETISTPDATHLTLTINLSVARGGGDTVVLDGTITVDASGATTSVTADLTITVNGQVFAIISGTDAGITIRHPDGSALSQTELQALASLFQLPDHLEGVIENLFHPCERLMGG